MKDYNDIIEQEEVFWKQKSRVKLLEEGDKNSKFFHFSTLIRRRRKKIEGLKVSGTWVHDKEAIKNLAVSHFKF
jgi:hypothetical protein